MVLAAGRGREQGVARRIHERRKNFQPYQNLPVFLKCFRGWLGERAALGSNRLHDRPTLQPVRTLCLACIIEVSSVAVGDAFMNDN